MLMSGCDWACSSDWGPDAEALENGVVAFFDRQPGFRMALRPRVSLAADLGLARHSGAVPL